MDYFAVKPAFHMAFTRMFALQSLLSKGGNVNAKTKSGRTVLMIASEGGHANIARALIEHGADVNMVDNGGHTALIWASRHGVIECVRLLLAAGADPRVADKFGRTAMHHARERGHVEIAKLLDEAPYPPVKKAGAALMVKRAAAA